MVSVTLSSSPSSSSSSSSSVIIKKISLLPVKRLFCFSQSCVYKFPMVDRLQICPQFSILPYVYDLNSVTFQLLPSVSPYLSNLGWFCDLFQPIEYRRSDVVPLQSIVFKWSFILLFAVLETCLATTGTNPGEHAGW